MSESPLSRSQGIERLRARRTRAKKRLGVLLIILALAIIGAFFWLLWQPYMRIQSVTVYGADQSYAGFATNAMEGSYLGIVPRNSALFYPAPAIRSEILAAHPEIAAISIFREGLTGLSIHVIERVAIARWCGVSYPEAASSTQMISECYLFDGNGYLYALASTTDQELNNFALYDALVASSSAPLGNTLSEEAELPPAFDFARNLAQLGGDVNAVAINGAEADDYVASSTEIMYLLGQEQQAYGALVDAKGNYDLSDGSLQYLDLRFPGKIYLKKN